MPAGFLVAFAAAVLAAAGAALAQGPAQEARDFGVRPIAELQLANHASPTPLTIPGARTLGTAELRAALEKPAEERPLLFDVLGGTGHDSIPGAIWLADAGRGRHFDDEIQQRLAQLLGLLARGDPARPMVFFCASVHCWLSYNAALRAVRLGYTGVLWYRGGIDAWLAEGGALVPMRVSWRRPERP